MLASSQACLAFRIALCFYSLPPRRLHPHRLSSQLSTTLCPHNISLVMLALPRETEHAIDGTGNQMPCLSSLGCHCCPILSGCLRTPRLLSTLSSGYHCHPILLGCLPVCSQVIPRPLIVASSCRTSAPACSRQPTYSFPGPLSLSKSTSRRSSSTQSSTQP